MEQYAELTKERLLNIKCRVNETSVPRIFRFLNADRSPHNISTYDFEIPVKKVPNAPSNIFKLTIGNGLTVQGSDDHELLVEVSSARATQTPNVYFWRLFSVVEDHTWLNGDWEFFIGKYDGVINADEIILGDDSVVEIIMGVGSISYLNTRSISVVSTATLTPNIDSYDFFIISSQAEALLIANPTGTAVLGNGFMIDLDDNGSAKAITYGALYTSTFVTLPTTTIAGKRMKLVFQYNGTNWELITVINEQ